ncbi:hypothetical protein PoB_003202600 [Plakobranchus ocellatus]|uniref:Uncharacterized protein n=1 Tax=Plakobranchus ocellatus TaxID=259542 RepID=A0AAV4AFW4_9GAST|nr:hypothetical protein PoB_003202600 [Plakobranchus ocellatus]
MCRSCYPANIQATVEPVVDNPSKKSLLCYCTKHIHFGRVTFKLKNGMRILGLPYSHIVFVHLSTQVEGCFITEDYLWQQIRIIFHRLLDNVAKFTGASLSRGESFWISCSL